ncbi:MAG: phage terminase large subunit [Archaeoglobus sp.]|nr:phage terminase large subunit [Archaeoglobus sp.]
MKKVDINELIKKFQEAISRDVSDFSANDPPQNKRLEITKDDPLKFAEIYTPHYIDLPFANFHREIIQMALYPKKHLFVIAAPREYGKTTLLRLIKLYFILHCKKHYIIKVSENLNLALNDISYIIAELQYNRRIKEDFEVDFIKCKDDDIRLKIRPKNQNKFHFVKIEPKSYGTSIVGSIFMQHRPDYAEVDDLENTRSARNPRIAREKLEWIMSELYFAISDKGPIIWVGNNHAKTCALNLAFEEECEKVYTLDKTYIAKKPYNLKITGEKTGHNYPVWKEIKGKLHPLWPAKHKIKTLKRIEKTVGSNVFSAQMLQNPNETGNFFKPEHINTYKELPDVKYIVGWIDPSIGQSKTSDFKAIIILGTDGINFYILDAWIRQASRTAMVKACYHLYEKYQPKGLTCLHIEDNFGQYKEVLKRDFLDYAKVKGYLLPIKPENNTIKKELRIESLEPIFENGLIFFPENLTNDLKRLKEQILAWPDAEHDDGPDALAGAVEVARLKMISKRRSIKTLTKRKFIRHILKRGEKYGY